MRKEDCFYLGRIVRKYGFKGELIAKIDSDSSAQVYQNMESVFIAVGSGLIPFSVQDIKIYKYESLRLRLENVEDEQDTELLVGKKIYLPVSFLPPLIGNQFYYHEIIGFIVIDKKYGRVGNITGVDDRSTQHLFQIKKENGKSLVLIPIVDEFIVKVDRAAKKIIVQTPIGLLDLK